MKYFALLLFTLASFVAQAQQQNFLDFKKELNRRFKDSLESPLPTLVRDTFKQLPFFPYNDELVFNSAVATINEASGDVFRPSIYGIPTPYKLFGSVTFILRNEEVKLKVYQKIDDELDNPELLLPFTDATNGKSTFGGGRYIDLKISNNQQCIIDFNKAYPPTCAYNSGFLCPLVPSGNDIPIEINAGVKFHIDNGYASDITPCDKEYYDRYVDEDNPSAAITVALKAIQECPNRDTLYGVLAAMYYALPNWPLCWAYSDSALSSFPDNHIFLGSRAIAKINTPLPKKVKDSLLTLEVMMDSHKFSQLEKDYLVEVTPNGTEIYDYKGAFEDIDLALKDSDATSLECAELLGLKSGIYWSRKNLDSAQACALRAIYTNDSAYRAYIILAEVHAQKGNLKSVEFCLDKAIWIGPEFYEAYELRARFRLYTLYDKLGACRDLRKAISLGLREEEYSVDQYCD